MTLRHVIDYYMDGHCAISYCKVCSAEGQKLVDVCSGHIKSQEIYFRDMTREEFEEKYNSAIDAGNKTAK